MAERRYRVGDRVRFKHTFRTLEGVVTEDIGPIGRGGRWLYLVTYPGGLHVEEPNHIQLGAEELEPAPDPVSPTKSV